MQHMKNRRRITAVLLAAALLISAIISPGIAYAIEYEPYYPQDVCECLACQAPDNWISIDQSNFPLTANFHSLQLVSQSAGMTLGVITQRPNSGAFFATSNNMADWTIVAPAASRYVYHAGYYYWYAGGLFRTSDWHTNWQTLAYLPDDAYLVESMFSDNAHVNQVPRLPLTYGGLQRIERLPFQVGGNITWVGFAVTNDTRRPIRLYAGGVWLNPFDQDGPTAIIGTESFGWARDAIEFVVARDLMDMYLCSETYEAIHFNPAGGASRQDVLAAAIRALGITAHDITYFQHVPFYDVPVTGRGVYVDIAMRLGFVIGVGGNMFAPARPITRQDMMTMLYNIMLAQGHITPDYELTAISRFGDVALIASYARLPISSLASAGFIAGDGRNINPRGYVTRVEAAMFVWNLYRAVG